MCTQVGVYVCVLHGDPEDSVQFYFAGGDTKIDIINFDFKSQKTLDCSVTDTSRYCSHIIHRYIVINDIMSVDIVEIVHQLHF